MPAGPRIVFTRFLTGDSPKLAPWMTHLRRVAVRTANLEPELDQAQGAVVWQLVSANNRELARGFTVHESFEGALDSATQVVAQRDDLQVELVSELQRGAYGWFASVGELPLIVCARWYDTERSRRVSVDLAIRSLAQAHLRPGTRLIDPALMETGPEPVFF